MYTYNTYIYIYIFMSISIWKDNSFLDDVSTTYMNKKETPQNLCKYRTIGEVLWRHWQLGDSVLKTVSNKTMFIVYGQHAQE